MRRPPLGTWVLLFAYLLLFFHFGLTEPTDGKLLAAGAVRPIQIVLGEPWRLLTASLVHIGLLHLAFNALFLHRIGPMLEADLGLGPYLFLYFVTAVGGNLLGSLFLPAYGIIAGGSTSLFGFFGAALAIRSRLGRSYFDFLQDPIGRWLMSAILLNLAIGFLIPNISNSGHVGGLLTGFALVFFFFPLPGAQRHARRRPSPLLGASFALLFLSGLLYMNRPYLHLWFQAREAWFATGERRDLLFRGLETRGVPAPERAFLEALSTLRLARSSRGEPTRILEDLGYELEGAGRPLDLYVLGIDPRRFLPFTRALGRDDLESALRSIPKDPWRWLPRED